MRWKLLTRGENSSRRLVLLRTAAFYSLGLCDTQTRINLTKGKFKTFVDFDQCWSDILLFAMYYCALQTQNMHAVLVQEADSLSMKEMLHSTQYEMEKGANRGQQGKWWS